LLKKIGIISLARLKSGGSFPNTRNLMNEIGAASR